MSVCTTSPSCGLVDVKHNENLARYKLIDLQKHIVRIDLNTSMLRATSCHLRESTAMYFSLSSSLHTQACTATREALPFRSKALLIGLENASGRDPLRSSNHVGCIYAGWWMTFTRPLGSASVPCRPKTRLLLLH
jgi:hypothetical protein